MSTSRSTSDDSSLTRRTLRAIAFACGSTVALTMVLSATAWFVLGRIASH